MYAVASHLILSHSRVCEMSSHAGAYPESLIVLFTMQEFKAAILVSTRLMRVSMTINEFFGVILQLY